MAQPPAVGFNVVAADIIRSYVGPRKRRHLRLELVERSGWTVPVQVTVYEEEGGRTKFQIFKERPRTDSYELIGAVSSHDAVAEICLDNINYMGYPFIKVRNVDTNQEVVSVNLYESQPLQEMIRLHGKESATVHAVYTYIKIKISAYLELIRDTTA